MIVSILVLVSMLVVINLCRAKASRRCRCDFPTGWRKAQSGAGFVWIVRADSYGLTAMIVQLCRFC